MTGKQLHILIAEDEGAHVEAIRRSFESNGKNVSIDVVGTLQDYREKVKKNPPDIALVDLNLPDGRAVEILSYPAETGLFPVLIMTSYGNEHTAVEAMKAGAVDYVVKSTETFASMPSMLTRVLREWNLIQQRRQVQVELRESEDFIKDVLNSLTSHIVVLDSNGVIVAVNEAWKKFAVENQGKNGPYTSIGADYLAVCENAFAKHNDESALAALRGIRSVLNGERSCFTMEYPCHSPSERRWFTMSVSPLRGPRRGVACSHENITQRKLAELRIAHLNTVQLALHDINQLIMQQKSAEDLIQRASELLVKRRSYESAFIVLTDRGSLGYAHAHASMEGKIQEALTEILNRKEIPPCCPQAAADDDFVHVPADDKRCLACGLAAACAQTDTLCIRLGHGSAVYGIMAVSLPHALAVDVEEQSLFKEMAGDLAFALYNIGLSKTILQAEKELDLLQSQFIQAQKMEAVGRLAGGVAHDFNNMLTIITGYCELALGHVSSYDPLHEELNEILKAADRSTDLTRQLLAFARKQIIEPKVTDLNKIVESHEKMLQRLIGEDINLSFIQGDNIWPVLIDGSQMDQILANLSVNARDAIDGVGAITIATENVVLDDDYCKTHAGCAPGEYVRLSFSDSGTGMDKETVQHIFEPFFTTKDRDKGTGLGLSTVYGIVKQNDGYISVYSETGQGTTFQMYFPRHEGKFTEDKVKEKFPLTGTETILVVDDEPQLLKLCQRLLKNLGYKVLTAAMPGEAIVICEKYPKQIDLLITDVIMPNMNGSELSERIKHIKPGIKTLFMSGYTANSIAHRGILAKGFNFIQKPLSIHLLAPKIRRVLDEK